MGRGNHRTGREAVVVELYLQPLLDIVVEPVLPVLAHIEGQEPAAADNADRPHDVVDLRLHVDVSTDEVIEHSTRIGATLAARYLTAG